MTAMQKLRPATLVILTALLVAYADSPNYHRLLHPNKTCLAKWAFLSVFYHKEKSSLFMNVLWTFKLGSDMEARFGSWYLLSTTVLMVLLSQGLLLLVMILYGLLTEKYPHATAVGPAQLVDFSTGFAGVLYSLQYQAIAMAANRERRRRPNSIPLQGLVAIAALQALMLSITHFLSAVCGILSGILYLDIPYLADLVLQCSARCWTAAACALHHTISEVSRFINSRNTYEYPRIGSESHAAGWDADLQWECSTCFKKNGVFFVFCERCREPRPA